MSSLQTILEAVSTLTNIQEADREGLLLEYREELKTALHSLHSLLQTPCASISESDSTFGGSTQLQGTSDDRNTPPATSPAPPPTTPSSAASPAPPTTPPSAASPAPPTTPPSAASPAPPTTPPSATSPAPPPTTPSSAASPAPPTTPPSATSPTTPPSATSPTPPPTTPPSATSPTTPPSAAPPPTTPLSATTVSTSIPKTIIDLLNLLDKRESMILDYMGNGTQSQSDWALEDPRIVDISQIEKTDRTDPALNLRSGFSALSLVDEYTEWELAHGWTSRLQQLCENLKSGNRGSRFADFVNERDFEDREKAKIYVRQGMQLRVFMNFLGADKAQGMAGIVSFCYRAFMRIAYADMPTLACLLASSKWNEHAICQHSWMSSRFHTHQDRLKIIQESKKKQKRSMQEPEPVGRKRQRLEPNSYMLPRLDLPIQDVNHLGHPRNISPQDNTPFTFVQDVNPLGHPHVIDPQDNTSLTFVQDVNPLGHPHVIDPQDNTSLTFVQDVNPLGHPHLNELSHNSSPSPLPSEHIPVAVQNVIAGIPNTL